MALEIYILDLIGTFTFAFYGAYIGLRRRFDIFGIAVTAFLTAVGGGTLRDLLLNRLPNYFSDWLYWAIIILGIVTAILLFPLFSKINKYALIIDAIGLVTFAFIGASLAQTAGLGNFGIVVLAVLTAVGGGLLRDIAIAETPQIFFRDFYASPAILLGVLFVIFKNTLNNPLVIYSILSIAFAIRVAALYYKIDLWAPRRR